MSLSTEYMGLKLKNPIVIAAASLAPKAVMIGYSFCFPYTLYIILLLLLTLLSLYHIYCFLTS